jgi:hypothetical protein
VNVTEALELRELLAKFFRETDGREVPGWALELMVGLVAEAARAY